MVVDAALVSLGRPVVILSHIQHLADYFGLPADLFIDRPA
jgi:hypothetical protein